MASLTSSNSKILHEYNSSLPPRFNGVEKTYTHRPVTATRNKVGEAEIDIFSAEKYFNGNIDEQDNARQVATRRYQDNKPELNIKPRIKPQTPSVYSESSWNSHRALLKTNVKVKANAPKKKFFANYCKCACSDKNSVEVEDYANKPNAKEVIRLDPADLIGIKSLCLSSTVNQKEEERKSIEVFSIEKKMSMLAWDAIPNVEIHGESIKDNESEASSDLFEIECLSSSGNHVISPGNGYAPSEASVAWSVVTASIADFSVLSDSEDQLATNKKLPPRPAKPAVQPKTRYGGILSGCNSQKAVRVADTTETRVKRSDSFRN